ncbi:hypothetical protein BRM94_09615 [Xanthomonas oryzae pv. oryzae]|nr:hypothetical protein BRM94_09615 [Xanthomonas oryzae pv. oryzae]
MRFKATLLEPAAPAGASGLFALLPAAASNRLPSRRMVRVAGHFAGHPLQATLQPDGQGVGIGSSSTKACSRPPVCLLGRRWRWKSRRLRKRPSQWCRMI